MKKGEKWPSGYKKDRLFTDLKFGCHGCIIGEDYTRDVKIFWIIFDTLDCFHNRYDIGRSLFIMNHDILVFYPQEIWQ